MFGAEQDLIARCELTRIDIDVEGHDPPRVAVQHQGKPSLWRVGLLEQQRWMQWGCGQLPDDLLEPLVPLAHLGECFSLGDDLLQQMAVDLDAGCRRHLSHCSGECNQVIEGGRLVTGRGQVLEQPLYA